MISFIVDIDLLQIDICVTLVGLLGIIIDEFSSITMTSLHPNQIK